MRAEKLKRAISTPGVIIGVVAAVALGLSAGVAFIGVICRYVLKITSWWIFPVQHYSYVFVVFCGAALASYKQIHVRVEALELLLKKKVLPHLILRVSMRFVAFAACCIFTYESYLFMIWVWAANHHDPTLEWFNLGVVQSLPFFFGLISCGYFGGYFITSVVKLVKMRTNREVRSKEE